MDEHSALTTQTAITHSRNGFIRWLAVTSSIVVIGIAGYGVFLVHQYLPIVGFIWLCATGALPTIGIVWLSVYLIKQITTGTVIHIGETGTVIQNLLGRKEVYHPLALKEYYSKNQKQKDATTVFEVPPMIQLLKEGVINTIELMLGYKTDGTILYGTWDTIRSLVIAGKSRSGKTVTLVFLICQALLSGAKLYVNDQHYNKASGLLKVLQPLWPYIVVGRSLEEILQNAKDFIAEMQLRLSDGYDGSMLPWIFICDEWTVLLRNLDKVERDFLVKLVLDTNEAYAGINGFCIIAGHEWTARESGGSYGASVRRAFHSTMVHRLDEDYAKFLLTGTNKKQAKECPNLPTGNMYLQDSEGNLEYLIVPFYGKNKEAITVVAEMLGATKQIETSDVIGYIPPTDVQPVTTYVPLIQAPTTEALEEPTNVSEQVKIILRMRKKNIPHRTIAYVIGIYGPRYTEYQELCKQHNIPLVEVEQN